MRNKRGEITPPNKGPPAMFDPCPNRSPDPDPPKMVQIEAHPPCGGKLKSKWQKRVVHCPNRSPPPRAQKKAPRMAQGGPL